mmetsp:Transcript_2851/g.6021  ORF Transcript_2851/g.6021 Transcript_2851/m.6021 type:complete len:224 (-) Transcript_2851:461-1132(-)
MSSKSPNTSSSPPRPRLFPKGSSSSSSSSSSSLAAPSPLFLPFPQSPVTNLFFTDRSRDLGAVLDQSRVDVGAPPPALPCPCVNGLFLFESIGAACFAFAPPPPPPFPCCPRGRKKSSSSSSSSLSSSSEGRQQSMGTQTLQQGHGSNAATRTHLYRTKQITKVATKTMPKRTYQPTGAVELATSNKPMSVGPNTTTPAPIPAMAMTKPNSAMSWEPNILVSM